MAKGKKGKKGKKGGKGKGKKRSKKALKFKGKKLTSEQADALMAHLLVESRKRSIQFYSNLCADLNSQMKILRRRLTALETKQHAYVHTLLETEDQLKGRIEGMRKDQSTFSDTLDLDQDQRIMDQRNDIEDLRDNIQRIENEMEKVRLSIIHENHYAELVVIQMMEQDKENLKKYMQQERDRHAAEIERLHSKHDSFVAATQRRLEHVINDLESVASQREVDKMESDHIDLYRRNKELNRNVEIYSIELQHLAEVVKKLEVKNLELVCQRIQVDWNLLYGEGVDVEVESEDEVDESETESLECDDDVELGDAVSASPEESTASKNSHAQELNHTPKHKPSSPKSAIGRTLPENISTASYSGELISKSRKSHEGHNGKGAQIFPQRSTGKLPKKLEPLPAKYKGFHSALSSALFASDRLKQKYPPIAAAKTKPSMNYPNQSPLKTHANRLEIPLLELKSEADFERTVREVIRREAIRMDRDIEWTGLRVSGKPVELKKTELSSSGPLKYYGAFVDP
ncbi:hypothetical protein BJ742DRAFT_856275 [Cladochytrium replicatum]|nr:hypothetical protein BJ742DRAFT_856275 [Cladochytrium replicatum]